MMTQPIFTVRDPEMSRWQSTVEQYLKEKHPHLSTAKIRRLPMMQGCWLHAKTFMDRKTIPKPSDGQKFDADSINDHAFASQLFLERAKREYKKTKNTSQKAKTSDSSSIDDWPYSTGDTWGWIECGAIYYWLLINNHHLSYNDYVADGNGNLDYSLIDWKIPSYGKVAIIGDWGTSNEDSYQLLKNLVNTHNPDCIVHLGDIYYSGTTNECHDNFQDVIRNRIGTDIPVFTIPGNHEYYSFGAPYYNLLNTINSGIPHSGVTQEASYFCLRTDNGKWQFLGLDTGYNDHDPIASYDDPPAPDLRSSNDVTWAVDKITNFGGNTIMLSHHQLFSQNTEMDSDKYGNSFANPYLYRYFAPYFKDKIAAWFWGHEHNFAAFRDGIFGLPKGRLVGCSSYEESTDDDPYRVNYPMVPFDPSNVQLSTNSSTSHDADDYFPHVGAILQFNGDAQPTMEYYSFPSWDDDHSAPSNPALTNIMSETINNPTAYPNAGVWTGNSSVTNSNYQTDKAPATALLDNNDFYIVYKNINDNDHLWWDKPSYSLSTGNLTASNPQVITPSQWSSNTDDDIPATSSHPAIAYYNGLIYLVYRGGGKTNLRWCTFDPSTNEWYKYGKISDAINNNPDVKSEHGPRLTVFNNRLYMVYLSNSDDQTVLTAHYDSQNGWILEGSHTIDGSTVKSKNGICPAIAANSTDLYMVYSRSSDSDKMRLIKVSSDNVWTDEGKVQNYGVSDYTPSSTKGMSICVDSSYIRMVYNVHDNNHYVSWAVYDIDQELWSGGLPILSVASGGRSQTSDFPAYCMNGTYSFITYPGNSTDNIYNMMQYTN